MPEPVKKEGEEGNDALAQLQAETERLKQEAAALKQRNTEYEKLLLDPNYLEYVAGETRGEPKTSKRKSADEGDDDEGEGEVDVEKMTPKQLVKFLISAVDKRVKDTVKPIEHTATVNAMRARVTEVAGKYEDFWDYKDAMVQLAQRYKGGIDPEDAYMLAKARATKAPAKRPKTSEPPTGGGGKKPKPPSGFDAVFEQAWDAAGLSSKE